MSQDNEWAGFVPKTTWTADISTEADITKIDLKIYLVYILFH